MRVVVNSSTNEARIMLKGRFGFAGYRRFKALCDQAVGVPGIDVIMVDLREVTEIDSAALGMLLLLRDRAELAHQRVDLQSAKGVVLDTLMVGNFDTLFTFH